MDTIERLRRLRDQRGWSNYRLARECGLNESTLANIFKRDTMPTIPTLEAICKGFGISMAQFFAEDEMIELTPELKALVDAWVPLTIAQKDVVLTVARSYHPAKE